MNLKTFWWEYINHPVTMLSKHFLPIGLTIVTIAIIASIIIMMVVEVGKFKTKYEDYTEKISYSESLAWAAIIGIGSALAIGVSIVLLLVIIYPILHGGFYIGLAALTSTKLGIPLIWTWIWMLLYIFANISLSITLLHQTNYPQWLKLGLNLTTLTCGGLWLLMTLLVFSNDLKFNLVLAGGIGMFVIGTISNMIDISIKHHHQKQASKQITKYGTISERNEKI